MQSSGGCVFGGYTDVTWGVGDEYKSSAAFFFFSLKDHAGIGPVKMPINSNKTAGAISLCSDYGPIFGGDNDLCIASNANTSASSECSIGETYQIPASSASDSYFLTGSNEFTVSNYEVLLVYETTGSTYCSLTRDTP